MKFGIFRFFAAVVLLPACWALTRALIDAFMASAGGGLCCAETFAFLGGILAFAFCWMFLPHFVKTYVFGHELTHALWGLLFGARVSRVQVSDAGGSVRLSKSNVFITLAPYFFPFYTFIVILLALIVSFFIRPLPWLPVWFFLVGLTWAFHLLFTLETLAQRQPDVTTYGRLFSWVFIYCANVSLVFMWIIATTPVTWADASSFVFSRISNAYCTAGSFLAAISREIYRAFAKS